MVAFLSDNEPTYAVFNKDEEGNYQLSKFENRNGKAFSSFLIQEFSDQEGVHAASLMFITNYKIYKIMVDDMRKQTVIYWCKRFHYGVKLKYRYITE